MWRGAICAFILELGAVANKADDQLIYDSLPVSTVVFDKDESTRYSSFCSVGTQTNLQFIISYFSERSCKK